MDDVVELVDVEALCREEANMKNQITLMLLGVLLGSCAKAEFKGTTRKNAEQPAPIVTPSPGPNPEPTSTPTPPQCTDKQVPVGAYVAFLVDNSNSNVSTDCPDGKKIGTFKGSDLYECGSATNREKAVIEAFKVLKESATSANAREESHSSVAIASFPTAENYVDGFAIKSPGNWLTTASAQESDLQKSLSFTRRPLGLTPYGAAMSAGNQLFGGVNDTSKARVAVLVTDGEPTDRDAGAVAQKAEELRAKGVEVFTVFVTNSQTRNQRIADHLAMLNDFNQRSLADGRGPWYSQRYASMNEYARDLLGQGGSLSLVEKVTSKVDSACQDKDGARCERRIVEVGNAAALTNVFKTIMKSVVRCE